MPRHITEYILYRWRYSLSYGLVGLIVTILLIAAVLYVPGGLSAAEMASTVKSAGLSLSSFDPSSAVDLPYLLLQKASFTLFGITVFSVKLPSLILGIFSLLGIILLLRHWFHMNVAVIAAVIVITTSQFIFSSQDGTPAIMYILIPTWLLLLALKVSRQEKQRGFWDVLFVIVAALSLYTPLSIYVIIALASATILHPHLRYIVGRLSRRRLLAASAIGLVVLAPLITALLVEPQVALSLLGIPNQWPDITRTILELLKTHFGFIFNDGKEHGQPTYTLPSLLLALLGAFHLFKTRHTARSYIIASWLLLLTPIILFNPTKTAITFVPVMLLIAAGIDELLHRWYSLFPHNPYARIAGLLPITLLVLGMALTGTERYFYSYRYSPAIAVNYSDDLGLIISEAAATEKKPVNLLVTEKEQNFYEAVSRHNSAINIIQHSQPLPENEEIIATRDAFYERDMGNSVPSKIITNGRSNESDRLYLYKTTEK